MGNMGTIPATGYESSIVQTFSSPTGTSHTMTYAANVSDMVLVINNVIQEPTVAYTTSGTTLTTATLVSGDTMYIIYLALSRKTVTPGANTVTNAMMVDDSINSAEIVAGAIDTAHIADNQITLAKMAGGTDGKIITYDASGDPVAVGPGTDGQVLTSTGAGSPPAFEAAGGGGGAWNFIGTGVASNSASLTLTGITSTYDTYVVLLSDIIPATDGTEAQLQLGDSSGIDSGGSDYAYHVSYLIDTSGSYTSQVSTGAAYIKVNANTGNATGEGLSATIYLGTPSDTSLMNLVYGNCISSRDAGQLQGANIWARRLTSIALTQVLFKYSSGNITSGRMSLYGIAHA